MKSRSDAPDGAIPNEARERKGKHVAHEDGARGLAQHDREAHAARDGSHLARDLLPRRERDDLGGLRVGALGRASGRRRRRGSRRGGHDVALVGDDGAADDLVLEVDAEVLVLRGHGEEELGDVVRVQGGGLGRQARGEVRVA